MEKENHVPIPPMRPRCCDCRRPASGGVSRRGFFEVAGGAAVLGLTWSLVRAAEGEMAPAPPRKTLVVKPILTYSTPSRRKQTSWRSWGGIETQQQAAEEVARIQGELEKIRAAADFPVTFLPVAAVRGGNEVAKIADAAKALSLIHI